MTTALVLLASVISLNGEWDFAATNGVAYLCAYMKGDDEKHLYYALADDEFKFDVLNDGKPILGASFDDRLVRDPMLFREAEGKYHLVATVSWKNRPFTIWDSDDLVHWKNERLVDVAPEGSTKTWAPEIFRDEEENRFVIHWTAEQTNDWSSAAIWYVTTTDFKTFSTPEVLYRKPGVGILDATVCKFNGEYNLIFRNKGVWRVTSKSATGPYANERKVVDDNVEGPFLFPLRDKPGEYGLLFDYYRGSAGFGLLTTSDLENWTRITNAKRPYYNKHVHFPKSIRHGSILILSKEERARLTSLVNADSGPSASKAAVETKLDLPQFDRMDRNWNRGWKFRLGDCESQGDVPVWAAPDFDALKWRWVDLPHDFEFELPWSEKSKGSIAFKPLSRGWYRKSFTPEEGWRGKKVLVEFEGLMAVGDVYLNGERVASTEYGYLGCCADIGEKIKWGEENVIAVRTDAGKMNGSRWYAGGGLVRDVRLVVKSPVSVARHGLYVTCERGETEWSVKTSVQLDGFACLGRANRLDVILEVFDPDGKRICRDAVVAPWSKMANQEVMLPAQSVADPRLWDVDTPHLYTAVATLRLNGAVVDRVKERFGFRTIEYGPDFGFKLNGRKVWLQGLACHADYGAVGCAAYERAIRRQFETMKHFGMNAIRCSHNPYSPNMLRLADEMGILVVDELIDKWGDTSCWNGRRPFTTIFPELITEWVKRDRNHPSVILWSLGNELQQREDAVGLKFDDWGVTDYRLKDVIVKRWDRTRPTTVAMFPTHKGSISRKDKGFDVADPEPPELSCVTEVASYNYMYKDYASYKKHNPNLIIFQSEASVHDQQRPIVGMDKATTVGLCYWGAIAYWGESDGWPKKGWNYSFFSHTLEPLPTAYLLRSFFSDEPVVRLGVINGKEVDGVVWNDIKVGRVNTEETWGTGGAPWKVGDKHVVYTYTNGDEVELLLNGRSLGVKVNNRESIKEANAIRWEVAYEPGVLEAVARRKGEEVARHRLETPGVAARLEVVAEHPEEIKRDGSDLLYLRVYAVDEQGRRVRDVTAKTSFSVEGPATLLAVDNGDHATDELFHNVSAKNMKDGFIMAIVRLKADSKPMTIKVFADGLPGWSQTYGVGK